MVTLIQMAKEESSHMSAACHVILKTSKNLINKVFLLMMTKISYKKIQLMQQIGLDNQQRFNYLTMKSQILQGLNPKDDQYNADQCNNSITSKLNSQPGHNLQDLGKDQLPQPEDQSKVETLCKTCLTLLMAPLLLNSLLGLHLLHLFNVHDQHPPDLDPLLVQDLHSILTARLIALP